jgi:hypothetical protein
VSDLNLLDKLLLNFNLSSAWSVEKPKHHDRLNTSPLPIDELHSHKTESLEDESLSLLQSFPYYIVLVARRKIRIFQFGLGREDG